MKTTIEVKGFEIIIDETEDSLVVTAMKEGETVEEFELSLSDDSENLDGEEEEVQDFEDFEGEVSSEDEEDEMDSDEMDSEDEEDEMDSEDEEDEMDAANLEDEEEVKLESFQSFINKRK
jgi:hypothetical protein